MFVLQLRLLSICSVAAVSMLFAACSEKAPQEQILVFAAASLRESIEEIGKAFEAETGTRVLFNLAGSNDLAQQIMAAPRADVFLSANESWMDSIENAGKIFKGMRRDLLSNSLVVIGHKSHKWQMRNPCNLLVRTFRHIAIGNPESVPAGTYAREWLASITCGDRSLWEHVENRVAPTPNVRAALGLVLADPMIAGVVYSTDQKAFADRTTVLYHVADGPQIRYVAARIADAPSPAEADAFYQYLAGPKAKEIFERYGFTFLSPKP